MGVLRQVTLELASGEAYPLVISGDYIRIVSSTGAVRVETDGGDVVSLQGAMAARLARFNSLRLIDESAAANTVVMAAGIGVTVDDTRSQIVGTVVTAPESATLTDAVDVSVAAGATTVILAANTARREALIAALAANGGTCRIGVTPTAARGQEIAPGASVVFPGTQAVSVHNPTAGACVFSIVWQEVV